MFHWCALIGSFLYHGATSPVGQGLLIIEDSRSHSDTTQSVGLLWKSDQRDAETWRKHNTPKRQTTMSPAVFEPKIPASERPQTHALYSAATGIAKVRYTV
jgi:GH43 family beta-xylosidase